MNQEEYDEESSPFFRSIRPEGLWSIQALSPDIAVKASAIEAGLAGDRSFNELPVSVPVDEFAAWTAGQTDTAARAASMTAVLMLVSDSKFACPSVRAQTY